MEFKEKLRRLARAANLSAREVAERAGVKSHSTVNRWMSGHAEPRLSDLAKLAQVLGCSVAYLADTRVEDPELPCGDVMTVGERRLVEHGRQLGVEQAARVLELAGAIGPVDDVTTFLSFARWAGLREAMTRLLANPVRPPEEGP